MTTATRNAAIDAATPQLLAAYLNIHRVLDEPDMDGWDRSVELSRAYDAIALAYSSLTGEKIGVALGWSGRP